MNALSIREAGERYGIPHSTLADWVAAGLIRVIRRAERRGQPTLIYEPDVAELAEQYRPGRSRWSRPSLAG